MPFIIVRNDITNMNVDAIVNSTSIDGKYTGGAEGTIMALGGPELYNARLDIGDIKVTQAMLTKGYDLHAKYVIHTFGPWKEIETEDYSLLRNTYRNVLQVAKSAMCESIAFPLISTGLFDYPKRLALKIAEEVITDFLAVNDMHIFLVVYDRESYLSSLELYADVSAYIEDNLIYEKDIMMYKSAMMHDINYNDMDVSKELENRLSVIDEGFSKTLIQLIDESGEKNSIVYNRANVDKRLFSKIKNNKEYQPSKNIAIAFAIALKLNLEETEDFLARAGYALSNSIVFDVIVEYCIKNKIYDIFTINELLYDKDQNLLGSTMN